MKTEEATEGRQLGLEKYGFEDVRLRKRTSLIEQGIDPYPYSFNAAMKIAGVQCETREREQGGRELDFVVTVAGRIWAKRGMGGSIFMDMRDDSGKIQLYFRKSDFEPSRWEILPLLDLGDIVGVTGTVFRTKVGELSVRVCELHVLAKSVVPIPIGKETGEKTYYRIADQEARYRERYLSWLLDDGDRARMRLRSQIISTIRRHMEEWGFLEVSTPTVEFVYGGAEARPFETSIWALGGQKAFLRISPELFLKRYIVAGFDKVFTICQNFRNEGIDHSHNPEFTMMEWYEAFTDYEFQMTRFESLVAQICQEICGSTRIKYQGIELDFTPPWRRMAVLAAIKQYGGIDAENMSAQDLKLELDKRRVEYRDPLPWGIAVAELFEAVCEEHLVQPTFIIDHPVEISPLTKRKRGDPRLVERFEPYVVRMEIGNAYSELTDPVDQLERLEAQRGSAAEYEVHPIDADFVKAIGCGMPPTGGVGLGIDRLIMLLTDAPSIRDIIPFPMYKPKS